MGYPDPLGPLDGCKRDACIQKWAQVLLGVDAHPLGEGLNGELHKCGSDYVALIGADVARCRREFSAKKIFRALGLLPLYQAQHDLAQHQQGVFVGGQGLEGRGRPIQIRAPVAEENRLLGVEVVEKGAG
jgi:hypothetical protein